VIVHELVHSKTQVKKLSCIIEVVKLVWSLVKSDKSLQTTVTKAHGSHMAFLADSYSKLSVK